MPADLVDATRRSLDPEKKSLPVHAHTLLQEATHHATDLTGQTADHAASSTTRQEAKRPVEHTNENTDEHLADHAISQQSSARHTAVVLTGFMGAGKSTVGRLLATQLGWKFLDLDQEIERATGQSIAALFAEHGEAAFREQEENALRRLIEEHHGQRQPLVLALGGGALESARTRAYLATREEILMVYLAAPLQLLIERCLAQTHAATRPVLADREQLTARWERRLPHYEAADLRIDTVDATPEKIAAKIAARIAKQFDPEIK